MNVNFAINEWNLQFHEPYVLSGMSWAFSYLLRNIARKMLEILRRPRRFLFLLDDFPIFRVSTASPDLSNFTEMPPQSSFSLPSGSGVGTRRARIIQDALKIMLYQIQIYFFSFVSESVTLYKGFRFTAP